ncbi:hypothetical protein J2Z44_003863 [Clostridium punense]|uniref:Uncharacterized protein n=1 Tax=Clostridium punense TaxID=1054297 RepID=A0ABS4K8A4_9CLOT|nr:MULTISPECIES: hypothetical protein [Clostridium]EQB89622.1 hypothetical protein M918_19715 [Clostridium sp. BL8]MBP2024013.1 hypothetical protein [Clostridium punense]
MAINFNTPKSCTSRAVTVQGTVAAGSFGLLTIRLDVTNTATPTRNRSFYREIDLDNTASATSLAVNASYTLSIVPKLVGSDTVTENYSFSYDVNE